MKTNLVQDNFLAASDAKIGSKSVLEFGSGHVAETLGTRKPFLK